MVAMCQPPGSRWTTAVKATGNDCSDLAAFDARCAEYLART
jgi:hypothetical protein